MRARKLKPAKCRGVSVCVSYINISNMKVNQRERTQNIINGLCLNAIVFFLTFKL